MKTSERGFVCPDWAKPFWDKDACMIVPCCGGGYAVVCNTTQVTVFVADTQQECQDFLGKEEVPSLQEQAEFDAGVDELFEELFRQHDAGEIPLATIGDFIPEEVKNRN
ncbi:MAG: hypothetical protein WCW87_01900 [Candidatus Paceibacterota bacterium]